MKHDHLSFFEKRLGLNGETMIFHVIWDFNGISWDSIGII